MKTSEEFWFADENPTETVHSKAQADKRSFIDLMVTSGLKNRDEIVAICGRWNAEEINDLLVQKAKDEQKWPTQTEVDRLEAVLEDLPNHGIIDLWGIEGETHEEGCWDPIHHVDDYRRSFHGDASKISAAVFYTWYDVENAIQDGVLVLHVRGFNVDERWTSDLNAAAARIVVQELLEEVDLQGIWHKSCPDIILVPINWQRRSPVKSVESGADSRMSQFSKVMKRSARLGYRPVGDD
jgi:hypothetical protein